MSTTEEETETTKVVEEGVLVPLEETSSSSLEDMKDGPAQDLPPSTTSDPEEFPPSHNVLERFLQNYSRRMARRPGRHLLCALLVAVALSVIGMVVGNFSVAVDNDGWVSRGTEIADRSNQLKLVDWNKESLFFDETGEVWATLMENVQPGWEALDENFRRRRLDIDIVSRGEEGPGESQREKSFVIQEYIQDALRRRLQENTTVTGDLQGCDVSWYVPVS